MVLVPSGTLKANSLHIQLKRGASVRGSSTMGEKDPSTEPIMTLKEFGMPCWLAYSYERL